jgi:hypothetical protein
MYGDRINRVDERAQARTMERNNVFHDDILDVAISPRPKCNARRMDPASARPSVAASKRSQMDSKIPHATTGMTIP